MTTFAKNIEPDEGTVDIDWHPRTETPPRGYIWASNGEHVWLLYSDGKPILDTAISVLHWSNALIPRPPRQQ